MVHDASGNVIGQETFNLIGEAPSYSSKEKLIAVAGDPAKAEASCEPADLTGPGSYEISDTRAAPSDRVNGHGVRGTAIGYDVTWNGSGLPPVADCVLTVYGRSGSVLFEYEFSFGSVRSHVENARDELFRDFPRGDPPADSAMKCEPK